MAPVPITRVAHCNLNCTALERSLAFYTEVVGLLPSTRTAPPPQPAGGFPLPADATQVQWDAWILHPEGAGYSAAALDLLEWKLPAPAGRPYATAAHLGLNRVRYAVADVDATYERFVAGGGTAFAPPAEAVVDVASGGLLAGFGGTDPDGVVLEFVAADVAATRPAHIGVNVSDLDASIAWYTGNLGLEVAARGDSGPQPGVTTGMAGECSWSAALLRLPGADPADLGVELRRWHAPRVDGAPYATANHVGIYRLAFMVRDIRAAHATLQANGVPGGEPVALDMGPGIPIPGGLWASFFPDPDGACIEFIEELA